MIRFTKIITISGLLSALSLSCNDTTVVDPPAQTNDQFHGDIVGRVIQKESHAIVYISQVNVIDSTAINPSDGSFKLSNVQLGNYDMTIRADNFRIYQRSNVMVPGGGVMYVGEIDLSTIPDLVSSYYPQDQGEIVYDRRFAGIAISVTFTHPMDRNSVESAFSTDPPSTGIFYWGSYTYSPIYYLYASYDAVTPVNPGAQISTFSKITSFTYVMSRRDSYTDTAYNITLSTAAHDTSGNHLRFPLKFTFRTVQSSQTIYGIQTTPVDGDIDISPMLYGGIQVIFPRRMDATSTEQAISIIPNDNDIFIWPQTNQLTIYTGGLFRADTLYTVTIDSTAKDFDGNPLGMRYSFSFQTAPVMITYTSPVNGELFVGFTPPIVMSFNSYIVKSSVQSGFSISPNVAGTFAYGYQYGGDAKNVITFFPSGPLSPSTKYTVTLSTDVKDLYEKHLKEQFSFAFITRPN